MNPGASVPHVFLPGLPEPPVTLRVASTRAPHRVYHEGIPLPRDARPLIEVSNAPPGFTFRGRPDFITGAPSVRESLGVFDRHGKVWIYNVDVSRARSVADYVAERIPLSRAQRAFANRFYESQFMIEHPIPGERIHSGVLGRAEFAGQWTFVRDIWTGNHSFDPTPREMARLALPVRVAGNMLMAAAVILDVRRLLLSNNLTRDAAEVASNWFGAYVGAHVGSALAGPAVGPATTLCTRLAPGAWRLACPVAGAVLGSVAGHVATSRLFDSAGRPSLLEQARRAEENRAFSDYVEPSEPVHANPFSLHGANEPDVARPAPSVPPSATAHQAPESNATQRFDLGAFFDDIAPVLTTEDWGGVPAVLESGAPSLDWSAHADVDLTRLRNSRIQFGLEHASGLDGTLSIDPFHPKRSTVGLSIDGFGFSFPLNNPRDLALGASVSLGDGISAGVHLPLRHPEDISASISGEAGFLAGGVHLPLLRPQDAEAHLALSLKPLTKHLPGKIGKKLGAKITVARIRVRRLLGRKKKSKKQPSKKDIAEYRAEHADASLAVARANKAEDKMWASVNRLNRQLERYVAANEDPLPELDTLDTDAIAEVTDQVRLMRTEVAETVAELWDLRAARAATDRSFATRPSLASEIRELRAMIHDAPPVSLTDEIRDLRALLRAQ